MHEGAKLGAAGDPSAAWGLSDGVPASSELVTGSVSIPGIISRGEVTSHVPGQSSQSSEE